MTEGLKVIAEAKEYAQTTERYRLEILVEGAAGLPPRYSVKAFHRKTYEEAIQKKITDTAKQGCYFNLEGLTGEETREAIGLLRDGWHHLPLDRSMEELQHAVKEEAEKGAAEPDATKKAPTQVIAAGGTTVAAK